MPNRDDWPSWDPVRELAPAIEWMNAQSPECASGIRRLAAVLAAVATGADPERAEALSARFEEQDFHSSDPDELLLQRWYERGVIIAAGAHRGRLVHTEASVNAGRGGHSPS